MSATSRSTMEDPRVKRSRAAAIRAARTLFPEKGYAGTTMEDIAALAGLSKRTLYNNYRDKDALFTEMVTDVIGRAEAFAGGLSTAFADIEATDVDEALRQLGRRLGLAILRPEIIALRRLLIGESGTFPHLAEAYFERAPGRVMVALAAGFEGLGRRGVLEATDGRRAAEHFAYLVVGALLDRAMLLGTTPSEADIAATADAGVETFLSRYGA